MAAAQRALYTAHDATRFDACDFVRTVCETAKQTLPHELDLDCEAHRIQLSNDAAMLLALIANELLTNAVKYRLNGRGAGTVRVWLKREHDSFLVWASIIGAHWLPAVVVPTQRASRLAYCAAAAAAEPSHTQSKPGFPSPHICCRQPQPSSTTPLQRFATNSKLESSGAIVYAG
jgi:hypothetical protein